MAGQFPAPKVAPCSTTAGTTFDPVFFGEKHPNLRQIRRRKAGLTPRPVSARRFLVESRPGQHGVEGLLRTGLGGWGDEAMGAPIAGAVGIYRVCSY
jgi:hypothetical protein